MKKNIPAGQGSIEEYIQDIFRQTPAAIAVLEGSEHKFILANNAYQKLVHRSKEELIGKNIKQVFPELEGQAIISLFDKVFVTGETASLEEVPVQLDILNNGVLKQCYFNFSVEPVKNSEGKIQSIAVVAFDITGIIETRKKIESAGQLYEAITQNTPDLIYVFDLKYRFTYANEALLKMWGRTWDESIGKGLLELGYEPWHAEMHEREIDQVIATKKSIRGEVSFPHDTLGRRIYDYIFAPVLDNEGNVTAIAGTTRDITLQTEARKKMEESALNNATLAAIVQYSEDAIVSKTLDGIVTSWNPGAEKLFGYNAAEMIGQPITKLFPEDRLFEEPDIINKIQHGEIVDHFQTKRLTKNGKLIDISLTLSPIRNSEGKIIGASKIARDITQAKIAEQKIIESEKNLEQKVKERTAEIEQANTELQKMNKELESFTYISSHDLQEPLRKIQTFVGRILEKEIHNLSDSGKDYFNRMRNAATRMQTLLKDLLAFSRINTSERKFETVNLKQVIEEVVPDFKEAIEEKKATIKVGEMHEAKIIPFQFRQLFQNLFSNSFKFSKTTTALHINIRSEIIPASHSLSSKSKFVLHIIYTDNGIGFEPHFSEKIFEVFQKLHGKDEYAGTGIGLAIVKKIIENHHGQITASGELGKGVTFNIYLPVYNDN